MALINKENKNWASTDIKYSITKKDMIGDLAGTPVGIVVRMMEEQDRQGNKPNVKVFQELANRGKSGGGFDWKALNPNFLKEFIESKIKDDKEYVERKRTRKKKQINKKDI